MSTTLSMWLGIAFVLLAIAATLLQAWLWSFPMVPDPGGPDPNGRSTAPRGWTRLHRLLGLAYVVIYLVLMWAMVPRLWEYQLELPARTVMHACMGVTIGVLLVTKISIIRWFQHFGKALPGLGLALLTATILLGFLSLPFAIRAHALTGRVFEEANLRRVERALGTVALGEEVARGELVSPEALLAGREVLTRKCAVCHDMRTILVKPRSASSWHKLVLRMADKPVLGPPMTERDVPLVTAYLVAISPDLRDSLCSKRRDARERVARAADMADLGGAPAPAPAAGGASGWDRQAAAALYEQHCTQCHELSDVEEHGGDTPEGWTAIVRAMIEEEEAEIPEDQARDIIRHLAHAFPKP